MLVNCTRCGALFTALQPGPCRQCREEEEAEFERVRDYLRDHPAAGVAEVTAGTGVSERRILEFLRAGRLRLQGAGPLLTCRFCGVVIDAGQVCSRCAQRVRIELRPGSPDQARAPSSTAPPHGTRMYTADRGAGSRRSER